MKLHDAIIVGQGLAGAALAHTLLDAGLDVVVINRYRPDSASAVAAGLINPLTGRRFVLSWRFAALLAKAKDRYAAWSLRLGCPLLRPIRLLRKVNDQRFVDDVAMKAYDPLYRDYISPYAHDPEGAFHLPAPTYEIHQAHRLDIAALLTSTRQYLIERGLYMDEVFSHEMLKRTANNWQYREIHARWVICCEGYQGMKNPWFSYLPFKPSKGEILRANLAVEVDPTVAMKNRAMVIPMDDHYWIGTHDRWDDTEAVVTEEGRAALLDKLASVHQAAPSIQSHEAAIRPTTKHRRPMIGQHPHLPGLYLMNGLGTKGSSLAPYVAAALTDHIRTGVPIDPGMDIARWAPDCPVPHM